MVVVVGRTVVVVVVGRTVVVVVDVVVVVVVIGNTQLPPMHVPITPPIVHDPVRLLQVPAPSLQVLQGPLQLAGQGWMQLPAALQVPVPSQDAPLFTTHAPLLLQLRQGPLHPPWQQRPPWQTFELH